MENFVMYNPVKLHFGKGCVEKIGKVSKELGSKALLITGKGSAKKNGAFDQVVEKLKEANIEIIEFEGIKSNPIIEDVDKAASLGKEKNIDFIVAVGGGSVIDSAKIIALALKHHGPAWDIMAEKIKPKSAVPLIAVLTLAATGTEMNPFAVVQNNCLQEKKGYGSPLVYPKHSFLDPSFTLSVPANYTAYGVVDLIAHSLEAWFGQGKASLSDRFIISIIKEALKYGPQLMNQLDNYELRANIMYAATCALNGMTVYGKKSGDWGVHGIGHCLSVMYDVPHGASLSIAYPAWLKLQQERIPERVQDLLTALFEVNTLEDGIYKLEYFFKLLGSPVKLKDIDIDASKPEVKEKILSVMAKNKVSGMAHHLDASDHEKLLNLMS